MAKMKTKTAKMNIGSERKAIQVMILFLRWLILFQVRTF